MRTRGVAAVLGALAWGVLAAGSAGDRGAWPRALVAFAALVIVPLGLALDARRGPGSASLFAAAALLGLSTRVRSAALAGTLAAPWLGATVAMALWEARDAWARRCRGSTWADRAATAARLFLPIGAMWALADRVTWTPFGFDALTVLLTAAHFHYAGFALPMLASRAARARPSVMADLACAGVIVGVPLVALGISATHAGFGMALETAAVLLLVASALGVAVLHGRMARDPSLPFLARVLFAASAGALAVGMALALLYGCRAVLPGTTFELDFMWTAHGSIQALGFALLALLGWWVALLRPHVRS